MNGGLTPLFNAWLLCNRWLMVAKITTISFQSVDVQLQISNGLPAFTIVEYLKLLLRLIILFLISLNIFQPGPAWANQSTYCLSKTFERKINDLEYHYSVDFDGPKSAIDRAGWTWINRSDFDGDYDFIQNPQKDKITKFPKLYSKPCHSINEFLGNCQNVGSNFSKATGVAFISGYKANLLSLPLMQSYAIFGDTIIKVPSSIFKAARYRGDIPSKKLAAIRGSQDELLIFDGSNFNAFKLDKAIPRKDGYPSWAIENDPVTKRDYVISNGLLGNKPFLYEIIDGPNFKEILLDKRIDEGPLNIFTNVGDTQSWIIERDGIYLEERNFFRRVAHRSPTTFITAPAFVGLTDKGYIYLQLEEEKIETVFQPYLLQKTAKPCDIPLDLTKDIELNFVD